jgi:RNA polymerase sigma factor (sigma-70 family)
LTEAEQNRLIVDNMQLVSTVAADFRGADIEYEDLIAIGRIGLTVAARNFDPSLGTFGAHASARIRTEIQNAIRSGNYSKEHAELTESEEVKSWDHWGHLGNARAIYEIWPENFDGSPETMAAHFDDIRDKREKFDAAFISLTPMERKAVQLVYLRDPAMTITEAARETRVSYLRTWRALERALRKMRQVIASMENNSGGKRANGVPPKQTRHGQVSGSVAA